MGNRKLELAASVCLEEKNETPEMDLSSAKNEIHAKSNWLKKGLTVDILDVLQIHDEDRYLEVKFRIVNEINSVPLFTDLTLKLTKAALYKLKSEVARFTKDRD